MSFLRRREEVIVCNVVLLDGSNIRIDVPVSIFTALVVQDVLFTNNDRRSNSWSWCGELQFAVECILVFLSFILSWHRGTPQEVCYRGGPSIN